MHEFLRNKYSELIRQLKEKGQLDDELCDSFNKAIAEFKEIFSPGDK